MVFGPNFKRKKGVQIGRRHKRGDSYRRFREQEQAARAQEEPPVLAPGDDGPGDPPAIAAPVLAPGDDDAGDPPAIAAATDRRPAKKKRSDDNWRTARSVKSALEREAVARKKEAEAVANLAQAQAQAKASARELFLSKKQNRVLEVRAADLATETEKQHRVLEDHAADLAAENKTQLGEYRAEMIVLERRLASLQQELDNARKDLKISAANRRVQGEMHKSSQRQQSRTHTRQLEEKDQLALRQIQDKDQEIAEKDQELRALKSSSFRDLREKEKEVTELKSQVAAIQLKLDLNSSDTNYKIAVAVKDAKAKEREHFKQVLDGKRTVIKALGLERIEAVDKVIAAERSLRVRPVSPPPIVSPTVALSDHELFESLVTRLRHQLPTTAMQNFAADVLRKCVIPGSNSGELTCSRGVPSLSFSLVSKRRAISATATAKSRHRWLQRKVDEISTLLRQMSDTPTTVDAALRSLAKVFGYSILKNSDVRLDANQCVALRDHMKATTNGIYRLKQSLDAFIPGLQIIPPNVRQIISSAERKGVIPSRVELITDLQITKVGNKRGPCNFYFTLRPADLLCLMIRRVFFGQGLCRELGLFILGEQNCRVHRF